MTATPEPTVERISIYPVGADEVLIDVGAKARYYKVNQSVNPDWDRVSEREKNAYRDEVRDAVLAAVRVATQRTDPVTPGDDAIDLAYNVGHTSMRYDAAAWPMALFHATPKMLAAAAPLLVAEAVAAERAKTANEIRAVLDAYDEYMDTDVLDSLAVAIGNLRAAAGSETTKEDGE